MRISRRLTAQLGADLSTDLDGTIPGELIAAVVRGVLDEHLQDAFRAPESLTLEARQRLEPFKRARSDNPSTVRLSSVVGLALAEECLAVLG